MILNRLLAALPTLIMAWLLQGNLLAQDCNFKWSGPGTFNHDGTPEIRSATLAPRMVGFNWVGDYNKDGKMDIASARGPSLYVHLATGDRDRPFTPDLHQVPSAWGGWQFTWIGDFDGNGASDIATAQGNNVDVHFYDGGGFTTEVWLVAHGWGGWEYTWTGDFNNDGRTDIASADGKTVYMYMAPGNRESKAFTSKKWTVEHGWGGWEYTWCADFNGDGRSDLASANGKTVYMYLSTGSGFTSQKWTVEHGWGGWQYTWLGDFNGDGKSDIASARGKKVFVYFSTGSGFDSHEWGVPGNWGGWEYSWAADFDGDGRTDIASANGDQIQVHRTRQNEFDTKTWTVDSEWGGWQYTWPGNLNDDRCADIVSVDGCKFYVNYFNHEAKPDPCVCTYPVDGD